MNLDPTGDTCFSRHSRMKSVTRLSIYAVALVSAIVIVILLVTLLPGKGGHDATISGREVLSHVPLVDGYNSLPAELMKRLKGVVSTFPFDKNLAEDEDTDYSWCKSDLKRMKEGMVSAQVFTVKVSCNAQYKDAATKALQQIDLIHRLLARYTNDITLITSSGEIENNYNENKVSAIIGVDGGHAIDNKLSVLRTFHQLGSRYLTLNAECNNAWSTSYKNDEASPIVLTNFGKDVVKEANRLGMIIDLAHSSLKTQLAVLEETQAPVIFSSCAVKALMDNAENIADEVLVKLKFNKGLVMITFDGREYDKNDSTASLANVVAHINYVRKKVGVSNVGLGCGFHKAESLPVSGLDDSSKYPALFDRLTKPAKGEIKWSPDDLKKLASENFIRVWQTVENVSAKKASEKPIETLIDLPANVSVCYTDL